MELKKIKSIKTSYLVIALVLGVLLMLIPSLVPTDDKAEPVPAETNVQMGNDECRRLESLIGSIDGVSDVSIFVTYQNTGVKNIQSVNEKNVSTDETKRNEQSKTEPVTIRDGSGESPFVREEVLPEVRGVIISARGIKNPSLKVSITEAVATAFGVSVHRVKILHKD